MSGLSLHIVIKFVNANAVYLSVSVFPCTMAHCVRIPMLNMCISDGMSPSLGLCLLGQSLWRESNVLDNWQLTMLPLSELCEFNPRWLRDNLAAFLWVIGRVPQPEKKQYEYLCMYACVRVCVHAYTHACMSVSMHVCLSTRKRLLWYCPIFTARRIKSNTNMLYAKIHFTIKDYIKICLCVSMVACRKVCLAHLSAHMPLLFWCDLCDWWTCYECYYVYGICVLCT